MRHRIAALVVALSAWFGLAVQFDATLAAHGSILGSLWILARYFTILVNLVAGIVFTAAVQRHRWPSAALLGGIALNAALVAIVYRVLIAGTLVQTSQERLADLFLHGVTPGLVLLVWFLCGPRGGLGPRDVLLWAAMPLLYFAYALLRGAGDGIYPYPFMDVPRIGWGATLLNAVLIAAGFLAAGFGLLRLDRGRRTRSRRA